MKSKAMFFFDPGVRGSAYPGVMSKESRSVFPAPQAAGEPAEGRLPTHKQRVIKDLLATEEGRRRLAESMTQPVRGTAMKVSAEPSEEVPEDGDVTPPGS